MSIRTIQIDEEFAQKLREILVSERLALVDVRDNAITRIEKIDEQIGSIDSASDVTAPYPSIIATLIKPQAIGTLFTADENRAPSGRMKKGASEELILNFFQQRERGLYKIEDITKATQATYATARRVLKRLVEDGKLDQVGSGYVLPATDLQTEEQRREGGDHVTSSHEAAPHQENQS